MDCPKCNGELRIQVQAVVSAPAELSRNFSKRNMRRKDVYFMGVLWETEDLMCVNPKCGWHMNGYGNYVTNLKKQVNDAKESIAARDAEWVQELHRLRYDANMNDDRISRDQAIAISAYMDELKARMMGEK